MFISFAEICNSNITYRWGDDLPHPDDGRSHTHTSKFGSEKKGKTAVSPVHTPVRNALPSAKYIHMSNCGKCIIPLSQMIDTNSKCVLAQTGIVQIRRTVNACLHKQLSCRFGEQ